VLTCNLGEQGGATLLTGGAAQIGFGNGDLFVFTISMFISELLYWLWLTSRGFFLLYAARVERARENSSFGSRFDNSQSPDFDLLRPSAWLELCGDFPFPIALLKRDPVEKTALEGSTNVGFWVAYEKRKPVSSYQLCVVSPLGVRTGASSGTVLLLECYRPNPRRMSAVRKMYTVLESSPGSPTTKSYVN